MSVTKVDVHVGGRHVAVVDQVADLRVHSSRVDNVLRVGIDSTCDLGHKTKPDLPRHDLVDFAEATLELFSLELAWVARIRLEDNFIESAAILGCVVSDLNRVEELFATLLDQLLRVLSELLHEIWSLLLVSHMHSASLYTSNAFRVLEDVGLFDRLQLISHLSLFSLLLLLLFAVVSCDLLSEDVLNSLALEVVVWLGLVLQELSDESVGRIRILDSLLSNFNLVADLCEQAATRLLLLVDLFASDEGAGLLEVSLLNDEESASCTSFPLLVCFDLFR